MGKSSLPTIVVAGNIVLDMFPSLILDSNQQFQDVLIGGQVIEVGPLAVSTGGAVSNTGISLHLLGVPVYLMGAVADDLLGREAERIFEQAGIDTSTISRVKGGSSYTIVLAPPGTDRIFLHCPGTSNTFNVADVDWEAVQRAGVFHLGYPTYLPALYANGGESLAAMFELAKATGVTTSLDFALPARTSEAARQDWHAILARVLPYVDLLLPSVEEMLFLLRRALFDDLCAEAKGHEVLSVIDPELVMLLAETLLEMGAGAVGLKAGYKGFYVRTMGAERLAAFGRAKPTPPDNWANRELWEPGFRPTHIASATGAGDAAVAGFLAAFVRGCTLESALRYACALGAKNLEAMDATSSIRSWEETTQLIEAGWQKNDLGLAAPDWRFDAETGQWIGPHDAHI